MRLKDTALDDLIVEYETKAETAYRNYQDTGNGRYWNTFRKNEDMADTLKAYRDAARELDVLTHVESHLSEWISIISRMPYMERERRENELRDLSNNVIKCHEAIERIRKYGRA